FSVRTPTAVVTDLGTEFAAEVREDGLSEFRVFQGAVEVAALRDGKAVGQPRKLVEGQAARVFWDEDGDASSPSAKIVVTGHADSRGFVRALPAPVFCTHQLAQTGEFAVAKDDLIDAGQPTLSKIELNSGKAGWGSNVLKLNDGDVYGELNYSSTEHTFNPFDGAVVTVTLNIDLHPRGYDVRSIVSLTGSAGGRDRGQQDRSSQKYDVAYSSVDDPDVFIPLRCDKGATVNRIAHGWRELQATLACRAEDAPIARGVAKLRFVFHDTASKDPESMYREIDVFGSPSASDERR
ncbi:MAG: FecR family protein, partial [Pirellulales bacterium]|nr:FecR family protein [Pirellulales bacterium]